MINPGNPVNHMINTFVKNSVTVKYTVCFNDNLWVGGSDGPMAHYQDANFVSNYAVGLVIV